MIKFKSEIDFKDRIKDGGHIQYKLKCMNCGLHYIVFSWYYDWIDKVKEYKGIFCPECGSNNISILSASKSDKFIFKFCS